MTPIQLALLTGLLLAAILYWLRMRSKLRDRAVVFAIILFGIVLVADPDLSTRLAHAFGVGRGADLVSYLGLLGGGFCLLLLFSHQRTAQLQITSLVRELAILRAEKPANTPTFTSSRAEGDDAVLGAPKPPAKRVAPE
jgi:small membrane protein